MIIRNARVVCLDRENRVLDNADVVIGSDGAIESVGVGGRVSGVKPADRTPSHPTPSHSVLDAGGRLLMPALINCHTHLYSTLARGIALPGPAPKNFPEILKKLWWRLDRALEPDDVYLSALVGLVDCAKNGVGTLVDHHSSPNACAGSLDQVERAFREVGLRGVLCYETSDRDGPAKAQAALEENVRFIERTRRAGDGLIAASFGLHASFTLSDRTLRRAVEAEQGLGAGFHIHVAEDRSDLDHARRRFKKTVVARLRDLGVLTDRTLAAHCIHVTAGDVAALARLGSAVAHNPQSNSNNAVGVAKLLELMAAGVLVGLGSDGYSPRMWDEFKTAFHLQKVRTGDPRVGYAEAWAAALLNNRTIARKLWGMEIGRIEPGARADLVLVDYWPPTPLHAGNLFGHVLFGIANAPVDTLIVNGRVVVKDKRCVTVDEAAVAERATRKAKALWERF
ncbi:MAG TPA: putative aminohydrolase SsnA [Gemmatimonadales bacterium]|nr:putative aminohydrolase SsnA [Gemmatimonadales bacterium]